MINKLKTNRAWSVSLSSRVTHASLSSSHGSNLFHANASNRHHTLLMLTCRSQLEVKTPITISINSIQPTAASSTGRMRHKSKPQISPSWFAPPWFSGWRSSPSTRLLPWGLGASRQSSKAGRVNRLSHAIASESQKRRHAKESRTEVLGLGARYESTQHGHPSR